MGDRSSRRANMTVQAALKGKEGNRGQWFHQTDSLSAKASHGCDHTIPLRERERTPDSLTGLRVKINTTCSDQTPSYLIRGKCFKRLLKSTGHEKGRYKSFFVFLQLFDFFAKMS